VAIIYFLTNCVRSIVAFFGHEELKNLIFAAIEVSYIRLIKVHLAMSYASSCQSMLSPGLCACICLQRLFGINIQVHRHAAAIRMPTAQARMPGGAAAGPGGARI
jgi:hypothetical protein